ncbi:hypothetical protein AcV5_003203 [Taiwanofungus camphoratus]|nr:hypothetical protein AcV5_003203 [Antrodia cinnamomea]
MLWFPHCPLCIAHESFEAHPTCTNSSDWLNFETICLFFCTFANTLKLLHKIQEYRASVDPRENKKINSFELFLIDSSKPISAHDGKLYTGHLWLLCQAGSHGK